MSVCAFVLSVEKQDMLRLYLKILSLQGLAFGVLLILVCHDLVPEFRVFVPTTCNSLTRIVKMTSLLRNPMFPVIEIDRQTDNLHG